MALFAAWLQEFAAKSKSKFVRDSERLLQQLLEMDRKSPPEYSYRVDKPGVVTWNPFTVEEFKSPEYSPTDDEYERMPIQEYNTMYWASQARLIEMYDVTTLWRFTGLAKSTLEKLNAQDIVTPVILSRSMLELTSYMIANMNRVYRLVEMIYEKASTDGINTSTQLSQILSRMVWGTRLEGLQKEHGFEKQTGIMEVVRGVSKGNAWAADLVDIYDYLCEFAHPNYLGNVRFWEFPDKDGLTITLKRDAESDRTHEAREMILWSVGWSVVAFFYALEMAQTAIMMLSEKFIKMEKGFGFLVYGVPRINLKEYSKP